MSPNTVDHINLIMHRLHRWGQILFISAKNDIAIQHQVVQTPGLIRNDMKTRRINFKKKILISFFWRSIELFDRRALLHWLCDEGLCVRHKAPRGLETLPWSVEVFNFSSLTFYRGGGGEGGWPDKIKISRWQWLPRFLNWRTFGWMTQKGIQLFGGCQNLRVPGCRVCRPRGLCARTSARYQF